MDVRVVPFDHPWPARGNGMTFYGGVAYRLGRADSEECPSKDCGGLFISREWAERWAEEKGWTIVNPTATEVAS